MRQTALVVETEHYRLMMSLFQHHCSPANRSMIQKPKQVLVNLTMSGATVLCTPTENKPRLKCTHSFCLQVTKCWQMTLKFWPPPHTLQDFVLSACSLCRPAYSGPPETVLAACVFVTTLICCTCLACWCFNAAAAVELSCPSGIN